MIKVDVEYKAFDAMQTSTEGSPIIFILWKKKKKKHRGSKGLSVK